MSNYVIWGFEDYPGSCSLKDIQGLDPLYRLNDGTPLAKDYPASVTLRLHPDFPEDRVLGDSLRNLDLVLVASARLKNLLAAREIPELEFLPVKILDALGEVLSSDYFLIHPIHPLDCLDKEHSSFELSFLDPESIDSVSKLVLDETRIPASRPIFRILGFWDITLVRRDLAQAITAGGFTGIRWIELEAYPE